MKERLWIAFGLLMGVSFAVQVAMPVDLDEEPETTYETAPRGHAALYELLARFDGVHGRWLSGLSMPAVEDTVWWIAAQGLCEVYVQADGEEQAERTGRDRPFRSTVEEWIEAGGTAIVWLSHPPLDPRNDPDDGPGGGERSDRIEVRRSDPNRADRSRVLVGAASARVAPDAEPEPEPPPRDEQGPDAPPGDPPEEAEAIREDWQKSLDETRRQMREGQPRSCRGIAGFDLPPRRLEGLEFGELPIEIADPPTVFSIARAASETEDFEGPRARILPGATLAFFDGDSQRMEGWRPLWVEGSDLSPFAIERTIGEGHLVVVADARVLTNGRLDRGDSAPFVFDWVADWGRPWIDEHHHGIVPESGTFRYLATSPAAAACVGLLALGVLFVWRGHAYPKRAVEEIDPSAPTLETFVDSLADLYAKTGDHARAFERYRALSFDRIRRALGLSPGTPAETILAILRTRAVHRPEIEHQGLRDLLMTDLHIENATQFERSAHRLDRLVESLRSESHPARPRANAT
jgi:hypothetical protein